MSDCYAKSRFSSLDEVLNRHYGYVDQGGTIEMTYKFATVETSWFVALMTKFNPTIGKALVNSRPVRQINLPALTEFPEVKEVTKYEPQVFGQPTLVRVKVTEKIGRHWRIRKYWRIAGLVTIGKVDHIRCDGPDYPLKETYVPANYRRERRMYIEREMRSNKLAGQQKRYRIATVPLAIRYARAVELRRRLDNQAHHAFEQGNMARYDLLDARAARVTDWLVHVAKKFPDLAFKSDSKKPTSLSAKMKQADKNARTVGTHVSRSDKIAFRKLREARLARQENWKSRPVNRRGAHK